MVTLGIRLRELWQAKLALAVSLVLAVAAALSAVFTVSLVPPRLGPRAAAPAGAHTQILINDRRVSVLDAGFDAKTFSELHQGTVLAAGLLVRDPVRGNIAAGAGIPVSEISFTDPQLPVDPPIPTDGAARYSVTVAARPTVPVLDVYAQAPSAQAARRLVDASVAGLAQYLSGAGGFGLRVEQIGSGAAVHDGGGSPVLSAATRFFVVFAAGCVTTLLLRRLRRTWHELPRRANPISA